MKNNNEERLKEKDLYKTTDLALAAMISIHYTLQAIDYSNPQKAIFIFKREEELDALVESYWKRELKVDPKRYYNELRFIKGRLYEKSEDNF